MRYRTPPYIRVISSHFLRVGLCSSEILTCRTCGRTVDLRCYRDKCRGVDRVDPSPRDHHQSMCVNVHLSDHDQGLTCRHVDAMGASDLHQTSDREAATRSSSDGGSDSKEIVTRSLRDRRPIAARSWSNRCTIMATIASN